MKYELEQRVSVPPAAGVKAFLSRVDSVVLALAPHTVSVAAKAVSLMNIPKPPPARLFVPLFPIRDLCQSSDGCRSPDSDQKSFVLQGLFQSHRCALSSFLV